MWREIGTVLFLFFIGVAVASTEIELRAIAHIESSSGKNINHPIIKKGMHKGHQAAGKYGLMPLTVKDLISKSPKLKIKYGYLLDIAPEDITVEINRDEYLDKEIATYMWNKLRANRTASGAAFAWYHGQYASSDNIEQSPYVIKFSNVLGKIDNETKNKHSGR